MKQKPKQLARPNYATVADYATKKLFHDELVELSWDYQPTDQVSFSLPATSLRVGDELLLTNGSIERPVWVLAVGPCHSSLTQKVRIDARAFDPFLRYSMRQSNQPKEPIKAMKCPACSRVVSATLNKCICGHYENCPHCYRSTLPDDDGKCPHCQKLIPSKASTE